MKVIMRLNAVSSSRPLTPSPLFEGGGGAAPALLARLLLVAQCELNSVGG